MLATAPISAQPSVQQRAHAYLIISSISLILLGLFSLLIPIMKTEKIPELFLYFSPLAIPVLYFLNQARTRFIMTEDGITRFSLFRKKHIPWTDIDHIQFHVEGKNDQYTRTNAYSTFFLLGPFAALAVTLLNALFDKKTTEIPKSDQVLRLHLIDHKNRKLLTLPSYLNPDFARLLISRAKMRQLKVYEF